MVGLEWICFLIKSEPENLFLSQFEIKSDSENLSANLQEIIPNPETYPQVC